MVPTSPRDSSMQSISIEYQNTVETQGSSSPGGAIRRAELLRSSLPPQVHALTGSTVAWVRWTDISLWIGFADLSVLCIEASDDKAFSIRTCCLDDVPRDAIDQGDAIEIRTEGFDSWQWDRRDLSERAVGSLFRGVWPNEIMCILVFADRMCIGCSTVRNIDTDSSLLLWRETD